MSSLHRPPVLRAGAQDAAALPSRIGDRLVYAGHQAATPTTVPAPTAHPKVNTMPDPRPAPQPAPSSHSPAGPTNLRARLPMLDAGKLQVVAQPLPDTARLPKGQGRHDHVFDLLTEDGTCVPNIPKAYAGTLAKAAQAYVNARPALKATSHLTVRPIPGTDTCGVWRISRAEAATTTAPGRKPAAHP